MMHDQPMTVEEIERKVVALWTSCWPDDPEEFKCGVAKLNPDDLVIRPARAPAVAPAGARRGARTAG
jgi:hypothetical protein